MYEGVIESVLIIHTIDGDYPIHIHGNGIECIYYLTLNANNENETKKEQKQEHLQVKEVQQLEFGSVGIGFESIKEIELMNPCSIPITICTTFVHPKHVDNELTTFVVSPSNNIVVGAKAKVKYNLNFTPTSTIAKKQKVDVIFTVVLNNHQNNSTKAYNKTMTTQFHKWNPMSKQKLRLTGRGGVVDLSINPNEIFNFGIVPCLMPREKQIEVTNTGTASVQIAVYDSEGHLFSNAGKSYKGKGMLCVRPVTFKLDPSETKQLHISVAIRNSGIVVFPFSLRLLGTKENVCKEWHYTIQAEGEEPQINDHVLSIMDNEHLLCLLPIQQNDGL